MIRKAAFSEANDSSRGEENRLGAGTLGSFH